MHVQYLNKLEGVTDPEQKRKSIGNTFIDVFEEEVKRLYKEFVFTIGIPKGALPEDMKKR